VTRFAAHDCRNCGGGRRQRRLSRQYVNRVRRFVRFLVDHGLVDRQRVAALSALPVNTVPESIPAFQDFLRRHRGLAERTIDRNGRMVMRLLPVLGSDPCAYDAGRVRHVILEQARSCSPAYVKTMTTALRAYLRFLAACGACQPGLDRAVPAIAEWRLSTLPRYLPAEDVERLIASCDEGTSGGLRDRAILLLLARLGLRAGDVAALRLDDVAWHEATLRVCGKARREVRLPLPQDVGDALLAYIERARAQVGGDRVFLRVHAPYRPFSRSSCIGDVVRLALKRVGITDAPSQGAGLLRHSAATAMLRGGATLETVGTVLRHRSVDTTAHYAKVDIPTLTAIAQPWPGEI
jgi:site-specific recombinase XerD